MERSDKELLLKLVPSNIELRKLYNQHRKLDKEAERFATYAKYSPWAALRHQEVKKAKLRSMDEISKILSDHRM